MDENIAKFKENIISSNRNIESIIESLKGIKGNTIIVGTGGSRVVAEFASSVLTKKNHIITKIVDSRDLKYTDLSLYENIFIVSYSGSNFGVKSCLDNDLNKYLLTSRKTKIKDEILLTYSMESEHSFISLNSTIVPISVLLNYYLEDKFDIIIEDIFDKVNKNLYLDIVGEYVNIYSGVDTRTSEAFIETTLAESGISVPLVHEKYSYCHGRSSVNKNHTHSAIYLGYNDTDLDRVMKEVLDIQMSDYIILESLYDDSVVNDFYFLLASIYLLRNIANSKKVDLSDIKYDKEAVKKLYYFKGSM